MNESNDAVPCPAITGFVYVSQGKDGPMAAASPGQHVRTPTDQPPWIAVSHDTRSIIGVNWPGKLWKVRIVREAPCQPKAGASYTRAIAVEVLDEVGLNALFEHNGPAIVAFLDSIQHLSDAVIETLRASEDVQAVRILELAWERWLTRVAPDSPFLGYPHAGTLSIGGLKPESPVGSAPSILHGQVWARARERDGDAAFVTEEDNVYFNDAWLRASACLQHALFAVGAEDDVLAPSERAVLLRALDRANASNTPGAG